ncbi:hypothetical protein HWV62_28617 [Athelia sp. TMB]|nr:hypothetical protein HWV62_28617 [Athelia sp. TMB]
MSATKPKAIIFDLLTAVLDSWTLWDTSAGSPTLGRTWRMRYLELTYGCGSYRPYEDLVLQAARDTNIPDSAPAALLENWDKLEPWPEAPGVLRALKEKGYMLGVITNCSVELGKTASRRCGIVWDCVLTAEEVGVYKPRKEAYEAIMKELGVKAEEAIFVAGSASDVPGAAGVGMMVVWHNRVRLESKSHVQAEREGRRLDEVLNGLV